MRLAAAAIAIAMLGADQRGSAIIDPTAFGACTACAPVVNRLAFQVAIAMASPGDTLLVPPGTFEIGQAPGKAWSLLIDKPLTIRGAGREATVLRMPVDEAAAPDTNNLIEVAASDVTIEQIALDGQKPGAGTSSSYDALLEHHRGMFVRDGARLVVQDVDIHDFTGDGIQIYRAVVDATVRRCRVRWNQRDGLSLAPNALSTIEGVTIVGNEIVGNSSQQIDNEHGNANHVEIAHNVFRPGRNDYAIALAGVDGTSASTDWWIHHNEIHGGIFVVWTDDVRIEDNVGVNATTKACVEISRSADRVQVRRNHWRFTQRAVSGIAAIFIAGTSGSGASDVVVADNHVEVDYERAFAISAFGAISVTIDDNELIGSGIAAASYAGIYLRTTVPTRDFERATIRRNRISDFGDLAIRVNGYAPGSPGALLQLVVRDNHYSNSTSTGPQRRATALDADGLHVVKQLEDVGNVAGCGVASGTCP